MSYLIVISWATQEHDSCSLFALGEVTYMEIHPNNKDQNTDNIQWPAVDSESEFVVVGNSKSFLEKPQIITGTLPYVTHCLN